MAVVQQVARQETSDPQLAAGRLPPHSVEAEQSLLGGLLLDNSGWDKIADIVTEAEFYRDDHRRIFRHIAKLIDAAKPADVVTVWASIDASADREQCGGMAYVAALSQNTPNAVNVRRYAEVIRDRHVLRSLASVADDIAQNALSPSGREVSQILDEAESKVFQIAESGARGKQGFESIQPVLARVIERVDYLYHQETKSNVIGTPTGYKDLDDITAGLQPGELIIIAGRPSMGKTALALNIAEHVAVENGIPVAIFSMEMSASQLAARVLGSISRIDQHKLRTGRLDDREWSQLSEGMGKLHEAPIFIDESGGLNALEVKARARRLKRQYGKLGLIVIDYLQLMSATSSGENRATEISEISRSLKALAKEIDAPIVALSQLSRAVDQRPDKRPIMSDLRDSGAIEQDADVVLFLYREVVYKPDLPDDQRGIAELIVGKQRNGPTGIIKMTFLGRFTRFENYADQRGYQ